MRIVKLNPIRGALLLFAGMVVYLTLYPFQFQDTRRELLGWYFPDSQGEWLDVVMNFYFFVPLGLLGGLSFAGTRGLLWTVVGASLLSLAVECGQAYEAMRVSSARDVLFNALGGLGGAMLARTGFIRRLAEAPRQASGPADWTAPIALLLWFTARWGPFVPSLRRASVAAIHGNAVADSAAVVRVASVAFAGFAVAMLLRAQFEPRLARLVYGLLIVAHPLQLLLIGRSVGLEETIASAIGLTLGMSAPARLAARFEKPLAVLALALLVARQFSPFVWSVQPLHVFAWWPFSPAMDTTRQAVLPILADKLFFAYYATRQLVRGAGIPLGPAMAAVTFVVLAGEWSQIYMPGRTPEITDVLLCLLSGLILYWARPVAVKA